MPSDISAPGELLVADSFRVRVNRRTGTAEARGWRRHVARFTRAVAEVLDAPGSPGPPGLEDFLVDAAERIAEYGEGFPRLELWRQAAGAPVTGAEREGETVRSPELRLSLRPLPQLGGTLELRSVEDMALRTPWIKGPNIARLAASNREVGAETLLLDREGRAVEGATTSLVWWAPGDVRGFVVAPPPAREDDAAPRRADRVPSVTEELLFEVASDRLRSARPSRGGQGGLGSARLAPADLARHEVWAVNALHGIRTVTSIDGAAVAAPDEDRLRWYREALDRYWEPLK